MSGYDTIAVELRRILDKLSPSDILSVESLRSCFEGFFDRGTENECLELWEVLGRRHLSISTQEMPRVASFRHLPRPTTEPPQPSLPPLDRNTSTGTQALKYFESLGSENSKMIKKLATVAEGFIKAQTLSEQEYLQLWCKDDVTTSDPTQRTKKIAITICGSIDTGVSISLRLLFFAHAVDCTASNVTRKRGERAKSAALIEVARICGMEKKQVVSIYKRRSNYLEVAEKWGLGCLLGMGTCATNIEKIPVAYVHGYLSMYFPEILNRLTSLDLVAAKTIIQGLIHFGWTYEDLAEGTSDLMKVVGNYVDLKALKTGIIQEQRKETKEGSVRKRPRKHTKTQIPSQGIHDRTELETNGSRHPSLFHRDEQGNSPAVDFSEFLTEEDEHIEGWDCVWK